MNDLNKIKIFYDAEFTGLHRNTTLISVGLISETGAYFYGEFTDYDKSQVNDWLQEHVIDNLVLGGDDKPFRRVSEPFTVPNEVWRHYNVIIKGISEEVRDELRIWLCNEAHATRNDQPQYQVQFYTDCYAYDWMLLNDLICKDGQAIKLPESVYYIPYDLSTLMQSRGIDPDITREEFISESTIEDIKRFLKPSNIGLQGAGIRFDSKHNSLWDAAVAMACFDKIENNSGKDLFQQAFKMLFGSDVTAEPNLGE